MHVLLVLHADQLAQLAQLEVVFAISREVVRVEIRGVGGSGRRIGRAVPTKGALGFCWRMYLRHTIREKGVTTITHGAVFL